MPTLQTEKDNLSILINQEVPVRASLETTYTALIEQLSTGFEKPDGTSMQFTLEAWPGGRWFRDLGNNNGHLWAHVQAIKRPELLELCGPLMMSHAVANNLQYRLSHANGVTTIKFHHSGFGLIDEQHRLNLESGWKTIHQQVKVRAERAK